MIKTVKQACRFNPIIQDYRMRQGIENLADLINDAGGKETFFISVSKGDLQREKQVEEIVKKNLAQWQAEGLVPDMEHGWSFLKDLFSSEIPSFDVTPKNLVEQNPSNCVNQSAEIWVTDPPYADAVMYHNFRRGMVEAYVAEILTNRLQNLRALGQ